MNVRQILKVPSGEISFSYPKIPLRNGINRRFQTLRVERQGLRRWDSFEEDPRYLEAYLERPVTITPGWQPLILDGWGRFVSSETMVLNQYQSNMILRVNIALQASLPGAAIISEPRRFSWSGDQELDTQIAPDLVVVHGNPAGFNALEDATGMIVAVGDAKFHMRNVNTLFKRLPGTQGCLESYLAQSVQYCINFNIRFGFVLTNLELVIFQLVRVDSTRTDPIRTRSSGPITSSPPELPRREADSSSPANRKEKDWVEFENGDADLPLVAVAAGSQEPQHAATPYTREGLIPPSSQYSEFNGNNAQPAQLNVGRYRDSTPERGSPSQLPPPQPRTPGPNPSTAQGNIDSSPLSSVRSSQPPLRQPRTPSVSQHATRGSDGHGHIHSSSPLYADSLSVKTASVKTASVKTASLDKDPSHVLIRSYAADREDIALRLYQLIMLAKGAKDSELLKIGPERVSFSALDSLGLGIPSE
ncbi:hypothetical protein F4802DRAFT_588740 [Xylaria palmicola]|nr:hypothetical protein F4802DRAFT_588740 [Xylaria palmicola]